MISERRCIFVFIKRHPAREICRPGLSIRVSKDKDVCNLAVLFRKTSEPVTKYGPSTSISLHDKRCTHVDYLGHCSTSLAVNLDGRGRLVVLVDEDDGAAETSIRIALADQCIAHTVTFGGKAGSVVIFSNPAGPVKITVALETLQTRPSVRAALRLRSFGEWR